jgi:hypothetical protein
VIVDQRGESSRAGVSRRELGVNLAIAASLLGLLAVSLWTVFKTSSGALVLAWTGLWCFGAGMVGWYKRSWLWPGLCPVTIIAVILLWAAVFGRSSWASAFVTMLGAMFAVAAAIGAVIGTWLGKRP